MTRVHGLALFRVVAVLCILAVALPAAAQLETRSSFGTNPGATSTVVADFNHDGKLDLAVASYGAGFCPLDLGNGNGPFGQPGEIQVFLGNGNGTFGPPTSYAIGTGVGPLAVADLNHDGNPDLVVADLETGVSVLLGNGDGTFQAPINYDTPAAAVGLVLGDFNGDGNLDIATINQNNFTRECDCLGVLLGNGDGTFQEPAMVMPLGSAPEAVAAGHFGLGGDLDLAVTLAHRSSDAVQILEGNGDGTFRLGKSYALTNGSMSIVAADLRKNGKTDLAVGEFGGRGVAVLLGNGNGSFEQPVVYPITFANGVAAADMNGDGILDLVVASVSEGALFGNVGVFLGNGDGTFQDAVLYPAGEWPNTVAVADFNSDHLPDVTVPDRFGDQQRVLLNTGVVSFSPNTEIHVPPSPPQTVTLTNTGTTSLAISSISVTPHFRLHDTCGHSVAPGANCSIRIAFDKNTTPERGTVRIVDSASKKPQVIALTSTSVVLSPSPLNFAAQKVGTTSPPMTMWVTNEGNVDLIFFQISIVGSDLQDFSVRGGSNCTDGPLLPGATCTVSVTFKPTATGWRSATIKFIDDGLGSPELATLTGTGT